jgi:hypothetical protein
MQVSADFRAPWRLRHPLTSSPAPQIPSNMIVQYTGRPSLWLPFCMSIWGTISILTGITHNFVGALLTRFFLGFVEVSFRSSGPLRPRAAALASQTCG